MKLAELSSEALNALKTYKTYDIGSDTYAHSTELIRELQSELYKYDVHVPMREPKVMKLFRKSDA